MEALHTLPPRYYTARDLAGLPRLGPSYELIEGSFQQMGLAGGQHGAFGMALCGRASVFVEDRGLGHCFLARTGFHVGRRPDTVLAPDWAFVSGNRLSEPMPVGFVPLTPDLVMEVRSPGEDLSETAAKIARWLKWGARMVWDLDPEGRTVTVCCPSKAPLRLGVGDILIGEDVLLDFELALSRVLPGPM